MMHAGKYTARDQGGIGSKWGTRNTVLPLVVKPHLLCGVNVQIFGQKVGLYPWLFSKNRLLLNILIFGQKGRL